MQKYNIHNRMRRCVAETRSFRIFEMADLERALGSE